ncbi:MAG: hypothetical protein LBP40_08035 [Campylobacteraceae bacterium]|jgi:hypothetical protein|nr:hypothetical protein [Campylobacteraceae bacterium]
MELIEANDKKIIAIEKHLMNRQKTIKSKHKSKNYQRLEININYPTVTEYEIISKINHFGEHLAPHIREKYINFVCYCINDFQGINIVKIAKVIIEKLQLL